MLKDAQGIPDNPLDPIGSLGLCHCDCHCECDCDCGNSSILQLGSHLNLKGNASRYAYTHRC
eukprot:7952704-Pyramimonas_sp.AAC.1